MAVVLLTGLVLVLGYLRQQYIISPSAEGWLVKRSVVDRAFSGSGKNMSTAWLNPKWTSTLIYSLLNTIAGIGIIHLVFSRKLFTVLSLGVYAVMMAGIAFLGLLFKFTGNGKIYDLTTDLKDLIQTPAILMMLVVLFIFYNRLKHAA